MKPTKCCSAWTAWKSWKPQRSSMSSENASATPWTARSIPWYQPPPAAQDTESSKPNSKSAAKTNWIACTLTRLIRISSRLANLWTSNHNTNRCNHLSHKHHWFQIVQSQFFSRSDTTKIYINTFETFYFPRLSLTYRYVGNQTDCGHTAAAAVCSPGAQLFVRRRGEIGVRLHKTSLKTQILGNITQIIVNKYKITI